MKQLSQILKRFWKWVNTPGVWSIREDLPELPEIPANQLKKSDMKIVIKVSEDQQFYHFVVVAGNGNPIATSKTYRRKGNMKKAIRGIKSCINARVIDETAGMYDIIT